MVAKASAKGTMKLLGRELYRACRRVGGQRQGIGELMDKRVAETGSHPSSILKVMMELAAEKDNAGVVAFCLGRGAAVDRRHMQLVAAYHSFASHRVMIESKAVDINHHIEISGDTLSVAVCKSNFEWADFCLRNGACPNPSVVEDYKPVIAAAAEYGSRAMVDLLLHYCAEVRGSGAIVLAAAAGQIEIVRLLLAAGASVNEIGVEDPIDPSDEDVGTPLHRAIANGHIEIAKLLIEAGANLALRDYVGRTPKMLAQEQHDRNGIVMELLESKD